MTDVDRESTGLTNTLITLSKGSYISINRLKHYVINRLKFRSLNVEGNRKLQNNGVSVVTEGGNTYYGVLKDIIELNYSAILDMCYSSVNGLMIKIGGDIRLMSLDFLW